MVGGTNYLYAAHYDQEFFLVLNISDPTSPSLEGSANRDNSDHARCVDVNDTETIAAIGGSGNVYVFNISDKNNPTRIDKIHIGGTVYDVEIFENFIYCTAGSAGLPVIDISVPNNPTLIFNGQYPGYFDNYLHEIFIDPDGDHIYGAGGDKALIFPINSSNLQDAPFSAQLENTAWSVEMISSSRLAVGDSYGRIYFLDISSLSSPSILGSVDIGSYVYGLYYSGSSAMKLLAADYNDGLNVIDFSSFSAPNHLSIMDATTSGVRGYDVDRKGEYVVLAAGVFGVLIYRNSDCLSLGETEIYGYSGFLILTVMMFGTIFFIKKSKTNIKN